MLKLEVVTPQKKALETEVDSVTLPGSEGELGILPDHIPLLTTLDTGIVSYTNGSQKHSDFGCIKASRSFWKPSRSFCNLPGSLWKLSGRFRKFPRVS